MAKKKEIITNNPHEVHYLLKNGLKVYPVGYGLKLWKIQVDNNGLIKTYPKELKQNEINDAIAKTIKHYYKKLKEQYADARPQHN